MTKLRSRYIASPQKFATKASKRSKSSAAKPMKKKSSSTSLTDSPSDASPLIDLGPLHQASVICRPSKTIRSPYVADVILPLSSEPSTVHLAHAPALDVGGLCSPGSTCMVKERKPGGKTSHSIELVKCEGLEAGPTGSCFVGAHPRLGEDIAKLIINAGKMEGERKRALQRRPMK